MLRWLARLLHNHRVIISASQTDHVVFFKKKKEKLSAEHLKVKKNGALNHLALTLNCRLLDIYIWAHSGGVTFCLYIAQTSYRGKKVALRVVLTLTGLMHSKPQYSENLQSVMMLVYLLFHYIILLDFNEAIFGCLCCNSVQNIELILVNVWSLV